MKTEEEKNISLCFLHSLHLWGCDQKLFENKGQALHYSLDLVSLTLPFSTWSMVSKCSLFKPPCLWYSVAAASIGCFPSDHLDTFNFHYESLNGSNLNFQNV